MREFVEDRQKKSGGGCGNSVACSKASAYHQKKPSQIFSAQVSCCPLGKGDRQVGFVHQQQRQQQLHCSIRNWCTHTASVFAKKGKKKEKKCYFHFTPKTTSKKKQQQQTLQTLNYHTKHTYIPIHNTHNFLILPYRRMTLGDGKVWTIKQVSCSISYY